MSIPKMSRFIGKIINVNSSDSKNQLSVNEEVVAEEEFASEEPLVGNALEDLEFEAMTEAPSKSTLPPPLFPPEIVGPNPLKDLREDAKFWSDFGTRLWRADRQMHRLNETEESAGIERLSRRFEEILETLHAYDIEIIDHTGERYDAGLSIKVLQFEPREGISAEMILETVKPTVRLGKVLISGEVIVATPIEAPDEDVPAIGPDDVLQETASEQVLSKETETEGLNQENDEPQHA